MLATGYPSSKRRGNDSYDGKAGHIDWSWCRDLRHLAFYHATHRSGSGPSLHDGYRGETQADGGHDARFQLGHLYRYLRGLVFRLGLHLAPTRPRLAPFDHARIGETRWPVRSAGFSLFYNLLH
jgi:hypothetical protein